MNSGPINNFFRLFKITKKSRVVKEIEQSKHDKLLYLESIRGLAAIVVVFAHLLAAFYPYPQVSTEALSTGSAFMNRVFYELPFGFLVAGHFSVVVFFVLSGYVLTYKYFDNHNNKELQKQALKRFFRLAIPVFCTVMLSYFMMSAGLMDHIKEAAAITGSPEAGRVFNFVPSLSQAFYDAVIGVFANKSVVYNPVLWTMSVELFGSFIVFGLAAITGNLKRRWWIYIGAIILLSQTYYMGFIIGMFLADLAQNTTFIERSKAALSKGYVLLGILAVIVIASLPVASTTMTGVLSRTFEISGMDSGSSVRLWHFLGATILLWLILSVSSIQRFLSLKLFVWVGSLSFAIYLLHYLVLYSLGVWVFVNLWRHGLGLHGSAAVASLAVILVTFVIARLWKTYVDDISIGVSRTFAVVMLRG